MAQSKRIKKIMMSGASWASDQSGMITPRDMSKLKRIAYLDSHGAEPQAERILKGIKAGPALDAGRILLHKPGASHDDSLRELVSSMRFSVEPLRKRK